MCRPSPIILLLLLVVSTYGGPWNKLVPAAIASSSSSAVTMEMIPQLRIELSIENCTVNGKFPIPESCETFYQCDDWDGLGMEMYKFTCPVGTIFDDHVSTCNFPSLFKSRPDCTSGEVQGNTVEEAINFSIVHAGYEMESVDLASGNDYAVRELMLNTIRDRTKRSAIIEEDHFTEESNVTEEIDLTEDILGEEDNITAECKVTILEHNITDSDFVANKALHSCKQIYKVDQYVDMVISMNPVKFPDFLRSVFNGTDADDYNNILKTAQNHTYIWRHGDDIMSGFRRTYELAKLFGPSFQRKFSIAQRKLEMFRKTSDDNHFIKRDEEIREDIELLQENLDFFRLMINTTLDILLDKYKPKIQKTERKLIKKKETLSEIAVAVRDLDEIVSFLEFVKKDAGKIQEKANMTMQKLQTLKDNTLLDKTAFSNIKESTQADIASAMEKLKQTIKHINSQEELIEEVEEQHTELTNEIRYYEDLIDKEVQEVKAFAAREESYTTSCSGCGFCIHVMTTAMEIQNENFKRVVSTYVALNAIKHSALDAKTKNMILLKEDILNKGSEVKNLQLVKYYLTTMIEESEKILPYIEDAILGLKDLERTFENVVSKLELIVYQAKEMQEPFQKRNFTNLLYVNMYDMQTNWNNSYSDIIDIGSCTDPDYYNALVEIIKDTEPPINSTSITELNCTTIIEPSTINDTTTTPTTPTTTQSNRYII